MQGLITALIDAAYRGAVEVALARLNGKGCFAEALRNDLIATVGKLRSLFAERAGELVALALRR